MLVLALVLSTPCLSQETEFGASHNGLIYADTTVHRLKFIVDSLNLKFKVCELNRVYLSKPQAIANFIFMDSGNIKSAVNDLKENMPYEDFILKYDKSKATKDLLVVKFKYKDYGDKDVVEFRSIGLDEKLEHSCTSDKAITTYDKPLKGRWVYMYFEKSQYSKESLRAFYFKEEFASQPIPEKYARMIQYSDCMVDTTTQVFYDKATRSRRGIKDEESSRINSFIEYIHKATNKPEFTTEYNAKDYKKDYEKYIAKYELWDSLRPKRVDSLRKVDAKFTTLYNQALEEAKSNGGSSDEFEEYVGVYSSKKTELELKRNRRVVGGCSMDNSPRIHALNIAKLSAETTNWEIFLRSHLDIMNDRFERVSDGSYAWGRRKTYIRELEVLDINVHDLLLGITLRIDNPSMNHYFGSIPRIGRALSETIKSDEAELKMLQLISDQSVDTYNRVLVYYLFLNYNHTIEDKTKQALNEEKLKKAVETFPANVVLKAKAQK